MVALQCMYSLHTRSVSGTHRCVKFWNNSDSTQPAIFNNRTYVVFSINVSLIVVSSLG